MKSLKTFRRAVSLSIVFLFVLPMSVPAQESGGSTPSPGFTKERLAQMLAPVALFPDSLLSQVLMAATYPLEVVEADRWIRQNPELKGDSMDEVLKDKEWDPSVKSLCHFPAVLASMSEKLAETTKLGDVFLAQQDDVMDMVQELRKKAHEQGNLRSSQEQKVVAENEMIAIEPANTGVIYVPAYDPLYVYGPWWYPSYPPYYWGPGTAIVGSVISFWPGIFVGFAIGSWSNFDWHRHHIHIDWNKTHGFHHRDRHTRDTDTWQHNPEHRKGVAYRHKSTALKFGQSPLLSREGRRDARGYSGRGGIDAQPGKYQKKDFPKSGLNKGYSGAVDRGDSIQDRGRDNAFGRVNDEKEERMSSERGRVSRENLRSGPRGSSSPGSGSRDGRGDRRLMGR